MLTAVLYGNVRAWSSTILLLFAVFLAAITLSIAASGGDAEQYVEALRLAPAAAVFVIARTQRLSSRSPSSVDDMFWLFAIVTIASMAQGLAGVREVSAGRLLGLTPHPNVLGLVAVSAAMLASGKTAPINLVVSACSAFVVWRTDSSLAIVSLASWYGAKAAGYCLSLLSVRYPRRVVPVILAVIAGVFIVAPLYFSLASRELAYEWFRLDGSSYERLAAWRLALDSFLDNPTTGSGFASGQLIVGVAQNASVFDYSHSVMMTYLGTTGLIGALSILALVICAIRQVPWMLMSSADGSATAGALLYAVLMFSSVEAGLQQMPLSWAIFMLATGLAGPSVFARSARRDAVGWPVRRFAPRSVTV